MIFKLMHVLTFIFIALKLIGITAVAAWSWWAVLAPSMIVLGIGLCIVGPLVGLAAFLKAR